MPTETRVFESVDSSPEAKAANAEYFKSQGIEHEVEDSAVTGDTKTPPATDAAAAAAAAPETKPGEGEGEDAVVDTETAADWDSAQTDGKRKSRYAKRRQEARELKASNEQLVSKTQQLEREIAELKAKPAPPDAGTPPKPGEATPPAGKPADTAAAAAEPKFEEAEPAEPKYADFEAEDDQLLAYQQALAKHTREWTRWDRRRDKFDEQQANLKAQKTEEAKTARQQRLAKLNENLTEIRAKLPDFDQVLQQGNVLTAALSGASTVVPGGLEAAYLLAKDPDKLKQFNEQTSETQVVNGQKVPTQAAWDRALFLLGQITGSAAPAPAPAGSPPAAAPSNTPPREEPAAPRAARGRASDAPGLDQLTGDARRDYLAKQLQ